MLSQKKTSPFLANRMRFWAKFALHIFHVCNMKILCKRYSQRNKEKTIKNIRNNILSFFYLLWICGTKFLLKTEFHCTMFTELLLNNIQVLSYAHFNFKDFLELNVKYAYYFSHALLNMKTLTTSNGELFTIISVIFFSLGKSFNRKKKF